MKKKETINLQFLPKLKTLLKANTKHSCTFSNTHTYSTNLKTYGDHWLVPPATLTELIKNLKKLEQLTKEYTNLLRDFTKRI